jgi:hypothetical protein
MALELAARSSSSAGRCASVGCTISEIRAIGQSVRSEASLLQTSAVWENWSVKLEGTSNNTRS